LIGWLFDAGFAEGCDLCGCYTPQMQMLEHGQEPPPFAWLNGWFGGVGEQFTHFATVQIDGNEVRNPAGQYENSSVSQLFLGYGLSSRFSLQASLPLIYREFRRPEGFRIDQGTESGIGDATLLLKAVAFHFVSGGGRTFDVSGKNPVAIDQEPDLVISAIVFSGVKFPTGATDRLKEEFHEIEIPGAPPSGIHGHDLTLGTGSYDGISANKTRSVTRTCFSKALCSLRCAATARINITLPMIWSGTLARATTSLGTTTP